MLTNIQTVTHASFHFVIPTLHMIRLKYLIRLIVFLSRASFDFFLYSPSVTYFPDTYFCILLIYKTKPSKRRASVVTFINIFDRVVSATKTIFNTPGLLQSCNIFVSSHSYILLRTFTHVIFLLLHCVHFMDIIIHNLNNLKIDKVAIDPSQNHKYLYCLFIFFKIIMGKMKHYKGNFNSNNKE